jgi:alpha-galactosidase
MTPHRRYVSADDPIAPAEGNQGQSYGLASWLPYNGSIAFMDDDYDRRSHIASAMALLPQELWEATFTEVIPQAEIDKLVARVDWTRLRRAASEWRAVADLLTADFYPLTAHSGSRDRWMAWQYDHPETGRGLVQAFRRHAAEVESMTFRLQGLWADSRYVITDLDSGMEVHATGGDLMDVGLTVRMVTRPQAALFTYART